MSHKLSIPERHQLRVAKKTVNMPDAIAGVLSGMSKREARRVIVELTGFNVKEYYHNV